MECLGSERVLQLQLVSMVERERDEGEAIALTGGGGQLQQEEEAVSGKPPPEGERDGKERDAGEDERDEKDRGRDEREWSEIRLAIEELSTAQSGGGGDGKPAASSPPTLPFLALSHLLLRVLGEFTLGCQSVLDLFRNTPICS